MAFVYRNGSFFRVPIEAALEPVVSCNRQVDELLERPHARNSSKGNRKYVHDGRMYWKHRSLSGANVGFISALCDKSGEHGCKGRAWFRENETFVKIVTAHSCDADPSHIVTTAIRNEENNLAATTTMRTGDIVVQVRDQARLSGIQETLPPIANRKRAIQRVRFNGDEAVRPPPVPTNLRTFVIPQSFREYTVINGRRPDEWLLADSGYDEAISGRVLIFGRKSYERWMHMVRRVFVDGTFKIAPPLFEQVFVVLAERDGFVFPIATALLPNKRMVTYRKFFGLLQDVIETLIPTALSCDFELGIQNAAKETWQDVSIDGCYWHLCANLYKHLQDEGLSVRYDNDVMFAHECRKVVAMACVPIPNLNVAFQALRENLPDELAPIMHWFENNYLGAMNPNGHRRTTRFPIDSWNLVERIMNDEARTNNYAEAYHKKVANQLGIAHPTLWKFIDAMKLVQRGVDGVYAEMTLGRDPPIKRLKYRKADDRIKKNVVKASCSWHLVVPFEYLGSIASNFRMAQGPYEEPVGQAADEEEVDGGDAFYQQEGNQEENNFELFYD